MKIFTYLTIIFFLIFNSNLQSFSQENPNGKKILMVINEGFWAPEYYKPREIFEKHGFKITVAGKYSGLVNPDKRNTTYKPVKVDLTYNEVNLSNFDAITFAGGNGAWTDYFPDEKVHKIVSEAFKRKMPIGLLCSSTGLLGMVNNFDGKSEPIAKGKHVTGYFRVEGILRNLGKVNYDSGEKGKPYVVRDGNLITGRDPESSELFGLEMANFLK